MNTRKQKHEQKRKEAEEDLYSVKVSFVAGIMMFFSIIKDIIKMILMSINATDEFSTQFLKWVCIVFLILTTLLVFLIMVKNTFDDKFKSRKIVRSTYFLTFISVVVFVIENGMIEFTDMLGLKFTLTYTILLFVIIVTGFLSLLFGEKKAM